MARSYMAAVQHEDKTLNNIEVRASKQKDAKRVVQQALDTMWKEHASKWKILTVARLKKNGSPVTPVPLAPDGEVIVYNAVLDKQDAKYKYKKDKTPNNIIPFVSQEDTLTQSKPTKPSRGTGVRTYQSVTYARVVESDAFINVDTMRLLAEAGTALQYEYTSQNKSTFIYEKDDEQ